MKALHTVFGIIRLIFAILFYIISIPFRILGSAFVLLSKSLTLFLLYFGTVLAAFMSLFLYICIYAPQYIGYDINSKEATFTSSLQHGLKALVSGYIPASFTTCRNSAGMPVAFFCLIIFVIVFIVMRISFVAICHTTPKEFKRQEKEHDEAWDINVKYYWKSHGVKSAIDNLRSGGINKL